MNTQPIEKLHHVENGSLEVHSVFYTIQGEGPLTGQPAVFIRLAGCNLQCPGCDTDYTTRRSVMSVSAIHAKVNDVRIDEYPDAPKPAIVITGGEPFRQNIAPLANALVSYGYTVQIETNGTLPPPATLSDEVLIVCSPKTGKLAAGLTGKVSAFKYVVKAGLVVPRDGLPIRALDHTCTPSVAKPYEGYAGPIYIQPMDEGAAPANRRNLQAAITSCMNHGHTLQVQVHKIIGLD